MESIVNCLLFAQAASPAAGSGASPSPLIQFVPLIFIIVIFYFLMIRPQQKRQKEHQRLIAGVKAGDHVVMSSGIHGLVHNVKEKTVVVKVADNVKIEFDKASVGAVQRGTGTEEETKTA